MRRVIIALLLTGIVLAGFWPCVGMAAAQSSELQRLLARLPQEFARQPEVKKLLAHLRHEARQAAKRSDAPMTTASITLPPGFTTAMEVSGLTDPHGFVLFPALDDFPCCFFFVEKSLNRVAVSDGASLSAFTTGLSAPLDLLASPDSSGPFGNFLYVTQSGANTISRIDATGAVTTFATLTSAPQRMAFSPDLGAFGTPAAPFLFVTLADGRIVKVTPTGTVSACASGLAGPQGLVFGPGGSAYKNVLFVAEATGNKISKVDAACTVTPVATAGLSAPQGLAISPGGALGPSETLYVANAGTRIDRVDKTGKVTAFASGLTQADTIVIQAFGLPFAGRLGSATELNISDAGAGVFMNFPSLCDTHWL